MPLFGHHHEDARPAMQAGIPGLPEVAVAQGWQPVSGQPFDGHLEDAVHDITRCMYGVPRQMPTVAQHGVRIGGTAFSDAFRGNISGRAVIVANAWTSIEPELRQSTGDVKGAAVCAVELPSMLPIACVQPRRFPAVMLVRNTPTGDPAFDERFAVAALPDAGQQMQVLTPDLRQLIMARDDWVFRAERYLFGCVSKGPFGSVSEVTQRIGEVLAIVAAIPPSVLPDHVDHSEDDLIARIGQLTSIEDAMAMLQQLTPDERDRLARSDTPLAALADVRTPQEAIARFKTMDPQRKMQLIAMFMRVGDARRGR